MRFASCEEEARRNFGLVAQRITRLTTDQKIPGSNPGKIEANIFFFFLFLLLFQQFLSSRIRKKKKKKEILFFPAIFWDEIFFF